MNENNITLVVQDRDFVQPLICGDVETSTGLKLRVVRGDPRAAQLNPEIGAAEVSFARHIKRISEGDDSWVGLPAFVKRGFSHRTWFVRRGSPLKSFGDLVGKRVGINEWPGTGNIWARAAAREQGLDLQTVHWLVGPIEGAHFAAGDPLPAHARYASAQEGLIDLLVRGDLDALVCPDAPPGFYAADAPMVRLLDDWRSAEQQYYQRTRVFPAYHIIGIRKKVFDQDPIAALAIYRALEASQQLWSAARLYECDTSPWLLADLEETMELMGPAWQPYGVLENARMIEYLCDELYAQGITEAPVEAATLFAPFTSLGNADSRPA